MSNNQMMNVDSKIYIAGHKGMVGSAIFRKLKKEGFSNIIFRESKELDLQNQNSVNEFFNNEKPEFVFLAAAKVGGIQANTDYPGEFIYNNIMIQTNIIHASYMNKVKKLLFLGSSCIYPKFAPQPIPEEALLTGTLEPTNDAYALAKITGIKMCQAYNKQFGTNFISVMPTNLYGPNDNYHPINAHVLPALIRRIHEAKLNKDNEIVFWGSGKAYREFLYVDDLADACFFLMNNYSESKHINIGFGEDISIQDLVHLVAEIIEFKGTILNDPSKPDGTPKKLLDSSKLFSLGWRPKINLHEGIKLAYEDFLKKEANLI